MDLSDLEAEVALLLNRMENQPEDRFELFMQLHERLNEMRAYGMPVPEDLRKLEADLEAEFARAARAPQAKKKARSSGGPSNDNSPQSG